MKKKQQAKKVKINECLSNGALYLSKKNLNIKDCCIECYYSDKKTFNLTSNMLEKLWNRASELHKKPIIDIGIKINDNKIFKILGIITIEETK